MSVFFTLLNRARVIPRLVFAWQACDFVTFGTFSSYVVHVSFFEHYGTKPSFLGIFLVLQILSRLRFAVFCNTKSTFSFFVKIFNFRVFSTTLAWNAHFWSILLKLRFSLFPTLWCETYTFFHDVIFFDFFDHSRTKRSLLRTRFSANFHFHHHYGTIRILFFGIYSQRELSS